MTACPTKQDFATCNLVRRRRLVADEIQPRERRLTWLADGSSSLPAATGVYALCISRYLLRWSLPRGSAGAACDRLNTILPNRPETRTVAERASTICGSLPVIRILSPDARRAEFLTENIRQGVLPEAKGLLAGKNPNAAGDFLIRIGGTGLDGPMHEPNSGFGPKRLDTPHRSDALGMRLQNLSRIFGLDTVRVSSRSNYAVAGSLSNLFF